jgi:polysaccharide biosynthesis transport protein
MELRQYFKVVLKWWWLIVISVVVAAGSSFLGVRSAPRSYLSRTTLMVGQPPGAGNAYDAQQMASFLSDMARREPVLRAALEALNLTWDWGVLQASVTSRVVPGTQMLEIAVLDTEPDRSQALTEEIAHQLIQMSASTTNPEIVNEQQYIQQQIKDLRANIDTAKTEIQALDNTIAQAATVRQIQEARTRQDSLRAQVSTWQATYAQLSNTLQSSAINNLSIVEPARYGIQVGSSTTMNVLMAAAIGLVLSVGAAFLLEYLDDSLKSSEDVNRVLGLPTLGRVGSIDAGDFPDKLITIHQPRSPTAEAYRMLRTNLQFSSVDQSWQTLTVTSASPAEGKSLTVANLAIVIAQSGVRVLLVDADLHRPAQHEIFGIENNGGLTSLLVKNPPSLSEVLQSSAIEQLKILTTGATPPNPSELLGSKRMLNVLEAIKQEFEMVIFDSPPILAVADASIIATRTDMTLMIVDAGHTRRGAAQHAKETLMRVGANIAGVVLNRVAQRNGSYAYYYTDGKRKKRQGASSRDTLRALFGAKGRFRRNPETKYPDRAPVTPDHLPEQTGR